MLNKYQAVTITSLDSIFSSIHTLFTTNIYICRRMTFISGALNIVAVKERNNTL